MRSAGKALPGVEILILGPDGKPVPTGEVGEVVTRSSNNMLGYWNLPDATAKTMTGDGWIHTGDAGYLDEDGYLFLCDRKIDMIISGGVNIYPAEIEAVLLGHPAVGDVAVFGIPDDEWGERVHAVIEPAAGQRPEAALAEELLEHCRGALAKFKCPRTIEFANELPRDPSGKLYKRKLRDPHWAGRERSI